MMFSKLLANFLVRTYTYNTQFIFTNLAATIHDITENFQIGFGSFVDKRQVPYISVESQRYANVLYLFYLSS